MDAHAVAWNQIVLLHGPPGTGKTSLCHALAHKLSIRLRPRFPTACLLEVNAHSLCDRYFGESGKAVGRLFTHINQLVEDTSCLFFLLIDEVESLTAARKAALSGNEPSDAVRVVNAVLTAIDSLRGKRNVLLLATSNVSTAIDVAFVDRADMRAYVGPPALCARYDILTSTLLALAAAGIAGSTKVASISLPGAASAHAALLASAREETTRNATCSVRPVAHADAYTAATRDVVMHSSVDVAGAATAAAAHGDESATPLAAPRAADSLLESSATAQRVYAALQRSIAGGDTVACDAATAACLFEAAAGAQGFSGRALRKLPLQAHARFLRETGVPAPLVAFAIARAVHVERQTRAHLEA